MTSGYHQTRSVEWLLASMMVAWGIGLLLPGNSMELPAYRLLGAIAPEPVWAAWSISIGLLRMLALYINGSWRKTPLVRAVSSLFGAFWWVVLGYCFLKSGPWPYPAGVAWFPVLFLFECYSISRGARDSYHSGALQRWLPT